MHTDARTLEDGNVIEADLCIVGAGAAGISMAMEFIGTPFEVVLLEAGGFQMDLDTQRLYAGKSIGEPYQVPLDVARLHFFGGTTGHWAGWCTTLDPIDFRKRDWVPHSGWPIERADLEPSYRRAHRYPELGDYAYDVADYETAGQAGQGGLDGQNGQDGQDGDLALRRLPLDEARFWTKMWKISPPTRFGDRYRDDIVGAENVHLFTNAVATELLANEPVTAVDALRVQTLTGLEHRVRARHYVLACNAIQNARLLLASNRQAPNGLGNDNDLVGRYFMDHFEMDGAQLVLADEDAARMYLITDPAHAELAPSEALQEEHELLNGTTSLRPARANETELEGPFQRFSDSSANLFRGDVDGADQTDAERDDEADASTPDDADRAVARRPAESADEPRQGAPSQPARFYPLQSRAEQSPNPNSRVVLSQERDALGMPYADLDWQFTELDKRSMRVFYEQLARDVGSAGIGRMRILDWLYGGDDTWPSFLSGGFHNMGTTRMHDDPAQGVTDADGRVHGLGNLYAAGGSTFTTSGSANPTLTIIALTVRLADHLKRDLR